MDIKLKNKPDIIFIVTLFLVAATLVTVIDLFKNFNYITTPSYFQTTEFKEYLRSFNSDLNNFLSNKDYDKKTIDEKVSKSEIENKQQEYDAVLKSNTDRILSDYEPQIQNAKAAKDTSLEAKLTTERDQKLEQLKKDNTKTAEDIKKELAEEKDKNYKEQKKSLDDNIDFKYFIKDFKANEIYTSLNGAGSESEYLRTGSFLYNLRFPIESFMDPQLTSKGSYIGYISVINPPSGYNNIKANYTIYNREKVVIITEGLLAICCLAIVFMLYKKGLYKPSAHITFLRQRYSDLSIDLRTLVFAVLALVFINMVFNRSAYDRSSLAISTFLFHKLRNIIFFTLYMLYLMITVPIEREVLFNKEKREGYFRNSISFSFANRLADSFKSKGIFYRIIIFTVFHLSLGFLLAFIILTVTNGSEQITILVMFLYLLFLLYKIIAKLAYLEKTIRATDEIAAGNLNYSIKEKGKGNLFRLAHNINNMKNGIDNAVKEQIKSERLKSELITNVSHDLKTPLTSIINYVNLLKDEGLSKDEIKSYVEVLDRKTQRLRVLIEDLFEASKMTSGAVELNIERLDVVQLLKQALAEFDEKVQAAKLVFKTNLPAGKVHLNLDGKKTWRVFENLIGNILKYSQSNTRVYIDLAETESSVIITMKNISAYEMDFEVSEIFERFKRGDASRNTEGSGLGLAIAKSIIELQNGQLNIEIDGDLFKAIVVLNK